MLISPRSRQAAPLYIGQPPAPSQEILAHGKEVWQNAKCWECHGQTGKGDGEKAPGLKDDFGFPVRPADLTSGQFKSGPAVEDIFRTMSTGLSGTPMPSYRDSLSEQDRWALAYYVLSLSAFKDPLTGEPLKISDATGRRSTIPSWRRAPRTTPMFRAGAKRVLRPPTRHRPSPQTRWFDQRRCCPQKSE